MSENRPVNRRSFLTRVAGTAFLGGAAIALVSGEEAGAITDRDSYDPVGRGHRCTDRDPTDGVGHGRWCRGGGRRRGWTGITDRDPTDRPGYGRGRRRRGYTDNDPYDPVGHGRR